MVLSPQQEGELIQKYSKLIWKTIHGFFRETNNPLISKEECYQECAIVLLNTIRRISSVDELRFHFPFREMLSAMRLYIVRNQSFRYPEDGSRVKKVLAREAKKSEIPAEKLLFPGMEDADLEDVPVYVDFERFYAGLGELEQKVVAGKLSGLRNRDIARRLGLSDVKITRILHRALKKYRANYSV